ncbi:MAG: PDDEXK nuclease domain-containing protein [Bacteroidia bacterium]|nr:PDDEXK nuclease domain-containing protein [Bacteroidia bacterium]
MNQELTFSSLVDQVHQVNESVRAHAGRVLDNHLAVRNWLIGRYIVEYEQHGQDRAVYGEKLVQRLSQILTHQIGRGFGQRSLELSRQFYLAFRLIPQTLSAESGQWLTSGPNIRQDLPALLQAFPLGWSHYVSLLGIRSAEARRFYEIEATANQWSVRELERQINASLYERLALSRSPEDVRRLAHEGLVIEKAADLIKDPLILEFLGLEDQPAYSETDLESAIIDHLQAFLLELGKGFLFEARQKRFTFDNDHFFVDLVFYNRLLRCYVLIDLKRGKLTHQDLGQMQMYVNYFDRQVKLPDELPTVGIVLCHRKNDALVELTLPQDSLIFASRYELYLPSKAELKAKVEEVEAVWASKKSRHQ